MPQRFKFKGLVVVFLLFFLLRNAAADDLNPNLRDLDDCKNGERGNIEIDIIDPDNSDNFDPGEIVDVEIDVRNRGDRTRNIIVEASLYNIDEEKTVEQDDEFIAKLDLDIPEEIDSGVYTINVDVLFEGESESDNINLEVICAENEKETNKKKAKEGGILFIAQSNMPSKDIRDIEVLDTGSTFTLLLFDIVLFLILIFLLLMIVRD